MANVLAKLVTVVAFLFVVAVMLMACGREQPYVEDIWRGVSAMERCQKAGHSYDTCFHTLNR